MLWHPLYLLFLLFDFINNHGKNELYLKQTWIIISFKVVFNLLFFRHRFVHMTRIYVEMLALLHLHNIV